MKRASSAAPSREPASILTWLQQADSDEPTLWTYGYERADQLTSAIHQTTGATPTIIKRYAYTYDPAGNRTSEQIDDSVTLATHDSLNRLLTHQPGGPLVFKGVLNEAGRVTINGLPATMNAANEFQASVPVMAGTTTVTINAVDASGNATEAVYEVDQTETVKTFTYDTNGNMTSDGTRTFEWDARNQLVHAQNNGNEITRFSYDALGRRVEKIARGVTMHYLYDAYDVVEERLSTGGVVRYYTAPGIDKWLALHDGETSSYLVADQLGSTTRHSELEGHEALSRTYDAWGRLDQASEAIAGPAFTGRWWEPDTGLYDYRARWYDPNLGRFLSEDPVRMGRAESLYVYAGSNPVTRVDPLGWFWFSLPTPTTPGYCELTWGLYAKELGVRDGWRYAHCMGSCLIARFCSQVQSVAAGFAKEALDTFRCVFTRSAGSCNSAFQGSDSDDNFTGATCPRQMTCERGCQHLKDVPDGPPGPLAWWGK